MKKLLLIGNLNTVFTFEFLTEILSHLEGFQISVLNSAPENKLRQDAKSYCQQHGIAIDFPRSFEGKKKRRLPHLDVQLHNYLRLRLCADQDIILVHGVPANAAAIARFTPKKARLVVSYYGSDLLRVNKAKLMSHRRLLQRADAITVATAFMRSTFSQCFAGKYDSKLALAQYGAKVIDSLCHLRQAGGQRADFKRDFGFPEDRLSVFVGYNGSSAQQHLEITAQLARLPDNLKARLYLVYFCSYGGTPAYLEQIRAALADSGIPGQVVSEYMKGERMARFRLAADLMLNLQVSDAFSASMQEHLEAGTLVIKGDWLVYPELEQLGAYVESIPALGDLKDKMAQVLVDLPAHLQRAAQNSGKIYALLSWTPRRAGWLALVLGRENGQGGREEALGNEL